MPNLLLSKLQWVPQKCTTLTHSILAGSFCCVTVSCLKAFYCKQIASPLWRLSYRQECALELFALSAYSPPIPHSFLLSCFNGIAVLIPFKATPWTRLISLSLAAFSFLESSSTSYSYFYFQSLPLHYCLANYAVVSTTHTKQLLHHKHAPPQNTLSAATSHRDSPFSSL